MMPSQSSSRHAPGSGPVAARTAPRRDWASEARSRVALEREVQRLSARLAEVEEQRAAAEGFAAVAAHELLEPLVIMEAYVGMVSESLDEREYADGVHDLEKVRGGAARLRLLIETLLHDARSSRRALQRKPVDLGEVVRNCVSLLTLELEARQTWVEVGELPEVSGEEPLLGGLFTNLLLNALKYGPRGSATIRVAARRRSTAWEISVDSEGPTISPAERERIFQPFHRGTNERRASGTGLGLAICRNIVERHGGSIGVTPASGRGNRFFFTLPEVEPQSS